MCKKSLLGVCRGDFLFVLFFLGEYHGPHMLKVLLVQIRKDVMKEHEYRCVLEKLDVSAQELVVWDIFDRLLEPKDLLGYDAIILGGSGAYCVSEKEIPEEIASLERCIVAAREQKIPLLGICFGHHLIAEALGGSVVQDRERQEVGTFPLIHTVRASQDPIFSHLPHIFFAQEGHKDHVVALPPGAVHLALTSNSRFQAFTFPGEPLYSVQFHPELDRKDVLSRVEYYRSAYVTPSSDEGVTDAGAGERSSYDEIIDHTKETPEAAQFLRLFLDEIVRGKKTYPLSLE